ncbi:hypothetical protein BOX15_Mlig032413g1, partial [Macrostomum lignano]
DEEESSSLQGENLNHQSLAPGTSPAQQHQLKPSPLTIDAPMSDKVQSLASNIYTELESLMRRYDEDVVKELMPLVVSVLEGMERAISERRSQEAELEMLREDHDQLLAQFERERKERKSAEERLMQAEDAVAEERVRRLEERETAQSTARLLELKARNAHELASRLEEKEAEARREFQRLHERHSELLRSHTEHVDRTRAIMAANEQQQQKLRRPFPLGRPHPSSDEPGVLVDSDEFADQPAADATSGQQPQEEPDLDDIDVIEQDEQGFVVPIAGAARTVDVEEDQDPDAECLLGYDDGEDIGFEFDEQYDGDDNSGHLLGVDREIENLIKENMDLIETKNALNIVKDDLIAKVDELTGEKELLREEADRLRNAKSSLKERVAALEEDNKSLREETEKLKAHLKAQQGGDDDDGSVPVSQRKRFTRVEMARILMERNEYKERLMELQDAVRYAELLRASRDRPDVGASDSRRTGGSGVWGFFNSLWSAVAADGESSAADSAINSPEQQQQHSRSHPVAANVLFQPLLQTGDAGTNAGVEVGAGSGGAVGGAASAPRAELQLLPPKPPGTAQPKPLVLVPPAPTIDRGD